MERLGRFLKSGKTCFTLQVLFDKTLSFLLGWKNNTLCIPNKSLSSVFLLLYLKAMKMLGTEEDNKPRLLRDLQMAQDKLALDL